MEAATGDSADFARSITEIDTDFGYWWCYQPASDHPDEAITLMIHIAKVIADAEAATAARPILSGAPPPEATPFTLSLPIILTRAAPPSM